jgi:hypothetical protein
VQQTVAVDRLQAVHETREASKEAREFQGGSCQGQMWRVEQINLTGRHGEAGVSRCMMAAPDRNEQDVNPHDSRIF